MSQNMLPEISLYISKSSLQDGIMKWSAVNSDTESDLYGEKMSLELYQKMLSYIKNDVPPPADFRKYICSDYWCGGMPYVSLAHYSDLNGKAVLGQPTELFIDGKRLKARGVLFDTPLGRATWKSLKEDEALSPDDEKIRISIAFLDLAHKHGENGKTFQRKSITSICPECVKGVGQKIYLDGYLVHLATTRKPVNPRTIMEVEDIMARKSEIKTRKEDALSIVKDADLVEEIEQESLKVKSDILVEMSDTEVAEEVVVEEAKTKKDPEDVSAKDEQEVDSEDDKDGEEYKDKKKDKMSKSLTAEDVAEIVKSIVLPLIPKSATVEVEVPVSAPVQEKSALDLATDNLYNSVSGAIGLQGASLEQRLESINPALQALGTEITALVRESMGVEKPATVSNDQAVVLEAITALTNTVKELSQKVAIVEEKSQTPSVQNRIPAPRSIQATPSFVNQSQVANVNPNSVANIVRRSVSNQLPLK